MRPPYAEKRKINTEEAGRFINQIGAQSFAAVGNGIFHRFDDAFLRAVRQREEIRQTAVKLFGIFGNNRFDIIHYCSSVAANGAVLISPSGAISIFSIFSWAA